MSNRLIFEHPLNERVRTFLRLQHLFQKVLHFLPQNDIWATRVTIEGLLDIVSITARADIRTELVKELDRNINTLNRIRSQPGVDLDTLDSIMQDLQQTADGLQRLGGQLGQTARDDDFLKSISKRNSIPGGACSFDLPLYHYWLTQPPDVRQAHLNNWMHDLLPVNGAIDLVLSLARTSSSPRHVVAEAGFFQEALDIQTPAQMVQVALDPDQPVYPEISGHKNRFSIRFLFAEPGGKSSQCRDDVPFTLTCCVF